MFQSLLCRVDVTEKDYWIGLELGREPWVWDDGTLVNYTNWVNTPPDALSGFCVRMSGDYWLDMACIRYYRYICEISGKPQSLTWNILISH